MKKKNLLGIGLLLTLILFVGGCASDKGLEASPPSNSNTAVSEGSDSIGTPAANEADVKVNSIASTPEKDTDLGLKNIKIDTPEQELTESQKAVIEYFDNDYLDVPSYEFLRRYPNVFQDTQLTVWGTVKKVISLDSTNYKLALWLNVGSQDIAGEYAEEMYGGQYIIVTGKTGQSSFMEGDTLLAYGRYTGIETIDIDGTSYTVPTVNAYNALYANTEHFAVREAKKFDYPFIKIVAETIFGKDIEIREPLPGEDLLEESAMMFNELIGEIPYLLVELENQSNANFTKFLFSTYDGSIVDAKGPLDANIERYVEFSADFEHFFLFTHNANLGSLKLAYYDKDFRKIWEREFEETTAAVYDYTKNNIYIVVNNTLHIINTETGEDTYKPTYVGEKVEIRKLHDGILMVSKNKSDGIMKSELGGDIIWTANLSTDVQSVYGLQLVSGNIVIQYEDENWSEHYALISGDSGDVLLNAESVQ